MKGNIPIDLTISIGPALSHSNSYLSRLTTCLSKSKIELNIRIEFSVAILFLLNQSILKKQENVEGYWAPNRAHDIAKPYGQGLTSFGLH